MPDSNTTNTNLGYLRGWFRTCPALSATNRLRINYLSDQPTEYALYASPSSIVYRENVLGESVPRQIQTVNYIFAAKVPHGAEVANNLAVMQFYDDVIAWMHEQNGLHNFPEMIGGTIRAIVPTLTAYPAQVGIDSAKYQIQIRVTYKYERGTSDET